MKAEIRTAMKEVRQKITNRKIREEELINDFLIETKGETIMLYFPIDYEVNVLPIYFYLKAEGKRILFPRVQEKRIIPVELLDIEDVKKSNINILEPNGKEYKGEIDEIVVPGLAFDIEGHRVGYGGGYYDKFLEKRTNIKTYSLLFKEQIIEESFEESHDIKIDHLLYR